LKVELDAEEAEHIQQGLLDMITDELDDDEEASSRSSESEDEADENETNIAYCWIRTPNRYEQNR
jgi:hypothetical protein